MSKPEMLSVERGADSRAAHGSESHTVCPQCGEDSLLRELGGAVHCDDCGWPAEDFGNPNKPSWRCFHCNETFVDENAARTHFGATQASTPVCQHDAEHWQSLERELARYREEDSEMHRKIAHMEGEHTRALMRAEEQGYARGLKDGRASAPNVPDQR